MDSELISNYLKPKMKIILYFHSSNYGLVTYNVVKQINNP